MGKIMPERKNMKTTRIISPYLSKNISKSEARDGSKVKRTLEPSSGGMGIRLNIAKIRLRKTINMAICKNCGGKASAPEKRISAPKTRATIILESGPAAPTKPGPYF